MSRLPPDLLIRIVTGFSFPDLLRAAAVCSRWRGILLLPHVAQRVWADIDLPRAATDATAARMMDLIPNLASSVTTVRAPFCRAIRRLDVLLARVPALTALDVRDGPRLPTLEDLPRTLRVLDLAAQPTKSLDRLPLVCPRLARLSLSGIPPVPMRTLHACVGGLRELVTLDLSAVNVSSSRALLDIILAAPPTLSSLKLDRLGGGGGTAGVRLARADPPENLGRLERLSFQGNGSPWSDLLLLLLLASPSLRRLNVAGSTIPPLMRLLDCADGHWEHLEVVQMAKAVQRLDHFALEDNRRVLPPSLLTIVLTLPPLPSPLRALDVSALSTTSPIMDELDVIVGSDAPSSHVSLGIDPIYILAVDGVLERARLGLASLSFCRICSLPLTEDAVASLGRLAPALAPGGSGALDARSCRSLNRKLRMELSTPSRLDRGSAFWDW